MCYFNSFSGNSGSGDKADNEATYDNDDDGADVDDGNDHNKDVFGQWWSMEGRGYADDNDGDEYVDSVDGDENNDDIGHDDDVYLSERMSIKTA